MSHHKLEIKDLHFSYPDGYKAVDGITISIGHGESVGIIGANGAGKSTLLMLLMGILFPDKGEIVVGDIPVNKKTLPFIRQRVGMVFQDPEDQLFMPTVYDDVAFGPRNYKLDEKDVEKRVLDALDKVGILHLKDRAPFKLSGGEKRAAAIATVLSMTPDILVMDEPTSALDHRARRNIMNILRSFEHTKIITSHDLDMLMEICSRIVVIDNGKVLADGAAMDILTDSRLLDSCGLDIPLSLQNCPKCGRGKV